MDDHLIQIVKPHLLQRFVDGDCGGFVGLQLRGHLAGHEQFFARRAAGADALAHAVLVAVGLRRIDQAVAQRDRVADGMRRLVVVNEPCSETELRELRSVCQCIGFLQHVPSPPRPSSFAYASSETGSHHSFRQSSPGTSTAMWLNQLSFFAPCQCLTLAGIMTTLPGCRLTVGLPSS